MGMTKIISTFLCTIRILLICLFVSYLILDIDIAYLCLHMTFHNLATPFYTLGQHITPWTAGIPPKLQIKNMSFSVFFSSILIYFPYS